MIPQVEMVLKKEVANTSNGGGENEVGDVAGYRQSLVKTLHSCSIRFASVAPAVVPLVRLSVPYHKDLPQSTCTCYSYNNLKPSYSGPFSPPLLPLPSSPLPLPPSLPSLPSLPLPTSSSSFSLTVMRLQQTMSWCLSARRSNATLNLRLMLWLSYWRSLDKSNPSS